VKIVMASEATPPSLASRATAGFQSADPPTLATASFGGFESAKARSATAEARSAQAEAIQCGGVVAGLLRPCGPRNDEAVIRNPADPLLVIPNRRNAASPESIFADL